MQLESAKLEATVLAELQLPTVGSIAILSDPFGAVFAAFQPDGATPGHDEPAERLLEVGQGRRDFFGELGRADAVLPTGAARHVGHRAHGVLRRLADVGRQGLRSS